MGSSIQAFSKLTGLPPPDKENSSKKQEFMEDALDWLRNNDPKIDGNLDDPTVEAVSRLACQPLPLGVVRSEDKLKAMEEAIDWLRKNDPNVDNVDDCTVEAFSELTGLSLPKKMTAKKKKKFMEDSLDWLRKNDP